MLPQVLLCDGIVGISNSDGGKRPGGLGSTSHDFRRPFTHPGRSADGAALEKQSIAGRDYCAAGLEGGGMKRRLVVQPELRELIARLQTSIQEREARPATERGRVPGSEGGPRQGRCAARDQVRSGGWRGSSARGHSASAIGRAAPDGPGQEPGDAAVAGGDRAGASGKRWEPAAVKALAVRVGRVAI
jgi:hypothetical protein